MFVLDCSTTVAGLSGPLRVNCFGSRDIGSVECSYDNGEIVEACELLQLCNEREPTVRYTGQILYISNNCYAYAHTLLWCIYEMWLCLGHPYIIIVIGCKIRMSILVLIFIFI